MKRFASGWAWMALAFGLWACASTREAGVLPADEQFQAAARLYEDGQYDRAVSAFQAFVFNYPQDPRVPEARWLAADSYYRMEDWATAAQEYLNYQRDFPREARAAEAIYQAGRAYQEMSLRPELDQRDTERAINVYDRLLVEYPTSEFAAEARERVDELRNKLAEKAYLNAEFYFDHEDFEAAEIYLADLIATFPQTEWMPAGYALLARTFCAQGLADRSAEVVARLRESYPDSEAARETESQLPRRCLRPPTPEQAAGPSDDS